MNAIDPRALQDALTNIDHNINALHGRVSALMAYVAELPGASEVDLEKVKATLATASLSPVDGSRSRGRKTPHSAALVAVDAIHKRAQAVAKS